jgi:hypothetical protein
MAFICVLMECMNKASAGWTNISVRGITRGIDMFHLLVKGNVHKSMDIFLGPTKISLPSYHTLTLSLWNTSVQPALHNGWIPKSEAMPG